MSLKETRQLGIEFERRVQTMIPETEIVSKLDTDTIYSFLNQYQDKFIRDIYKVMDNIPTPSKPSSYVESIIQDLIVHKKYTVNSKNNQFSIEIPDDFGLYIDSTTSVKDSSRYKTYDNGSFNGKGEIPNVMLSKTKAQEYITRPQDSMRIIRQPIAFLDGNDKTGYIKVYHDRYTKPEYLNLSYYRYPKYMKLAPGSECELDSKVFDDLVTGAVDLYVQYVAGAEARKRQMSEQQKRNNKEDEQ